MRIYHQVELGDEQEVDKWLACLGRTLRFTDGSSRRIWLPRLTWRTHDHVVARGYPKEELLELAAEHSDHTGYPFEITFAYVINYVAFEYEDFDRVGNGECPGGRS